MNSNMLGLILGLFASFGILMLAIIVFMVIINWKLFVKAGKPGWASIIPVYNMIILFEIIGYKWYYVFILFLGAVPVIGGIIVILFTISYSIKLAKSFGQSAGFGIGLWLLNPIFTAIVAFSKDIKYIGPSVNGDIDFNDMF